MNEHVSLKKNATLNVIKRLLQIAFPLITFPYISRVLGTENFGKYNFSLSVISYFTLIAGIGVNTYAVREGAGIRDDKVGLERFISQMFTINLIFTAVAYASLFFIGLIWTKLHKYWLLLLIQSTTIFSITIGVDYLNIIFEDYEYMTKRYIFIKIVSLVLMFVLIHKSQDYILYALIVTASEILANVINVFYVRRYCSVKLTRRPLMLKHLPALLILFTNSIAITIYSNLDITMLGVFANDSMVGVYSLASKIYQIAKSVLNAIAVVMVPRLAYCLRMNNHDKYNQFLNKAVKAILVFIIPVATGIFMLSKQVIYIIGGKSYLGGNIPLRILLVALLPACIASIFFDGVLIVNRKEKYCLISTMVSASINVLLNLAFIPKWGATGAAITTLIAEVINCILCIFFSKELHSLQLKFRQDILSVLIGGALIVFACTLCRFFDNNYVYIMLCIIVSALAYIIPLTVFKNSIFLMGASWIKKILGKYIRH